MKKYTFFSVENEEEQPLSEAKNGLHAVHLATKLCVERGETLNSVWLEDRNDNYIVFNPLVGE